MFRTLVVLLAVAPACGGSTKTNPESPQDAALPSPPPEPAAEPAPEPEQAATPQTPEELYAACRERVEGMEKADECKVDADCASAGCGGEVCVTVAEKANVITTCEERPCFQVLDTCGCHEGKCTWTVKAEVPAPTPGPAGALPPTAPAPAEPAPEPAPE